MTNNKPKRFSPPSNMSPISVPKNHPAPHRALTCRRLASQTSVMAQTYLLFDFGPDEEKVQQARHKLESWKQAFRLDKKLQYKLEREHEQPAVPVPAEAKPEPTKTEKAKSAKTKSQSKSKSNEPAVENSGPVKLFVRLYFSGHEKLSEQRWIDRIPSEEPFKSASPKTVREAEPGFADVLKQFDTLE
jgi:hypothetical protein